MREERRPGCAGRLVIFDRQSQFQVPYGQTLAVGDTFQAFRGNGPREGDYLGTATILRFKDGGPVLALHFGGDEAEQP